MNTQIEQLIENIEKIIVGKRSSVVMVITAMLSQGHILIEDVPGVGKTRLVSALASSVDGHFNRIQLTPDIMPSDIVGFSMVDRNTGELQYKAGAAMCNFLLADEINRASPKDSQVCWKLWRNTKFPLTAGQWYCRHRSWCLPRRTLLKLTVHITCPKHRWTDS